MHIFLFAANFHEQFRVVHAIFCNYVVALAMSRADKLSVWIVFIFITVLNNLDALLLLYSPFIDAKGCVNPLLIELTFL